MKYTGKILTFFGPRNFVPSENAKEKFNRIVENIISENDISICYFGEYGNFDIFTFECFLKIKSHYPNIEGHLILPYRSWSDLDWFIKTKKAEGYDNCYFLEHQCTFGKYAIIERNKKMIDNSEIVVFYFDENNQKKGGTQIAFNYAKSKHKKIINIFNLLD